MHIALFGVSFLPQVGGMEYAMHYLANALVDHGHRVTVVARRARGTVALESRYQIVRYGLPFRGGYRFRFNRITGRRALAALHAQSPIDVVNIHSVAEAPEIALPFLRHTQIPIVMTPHGEDVQRVPSIGYGMRLDPRWDKAVADHLSHAHVITTISESVRRELPQAVADRAIPIPNGISAGVFSPGYSRFLHKRCGVTESARFVLSVGRNHIKKGYADGIAAFANAAGNGSLDGWYYALVGKGVGTLQKEVERLNMQERVFLIDQLGAGDLRECYRSASIFFSPSIIEGLSLVSIEAMACGLPLVVTDVPGNADIAAENGCGIIVPALDPVDMATGIVTLASDEPRRQELAGIAARNASRYEWPTVATRYLAAYKRAQERARQVSVA